MLRATSMWLENSKQSQLGDIREYAPLCCRSKSTGQAHRKEGRRMRFLYTLALWTWDAKSTAESAAAGDQRDHWSVSSVQWPEYSAWHHLGLSGSWLSCGLWVPHLRGESIKEVHSSSLFSMGLSRRFAVTAKASIFSFVVSTTSRAGADLGSSSDVSCCGGPTSEFCMQHKVPRQLTFRLKILRASQGNIHLLPPLFSLARPSNVERKVHSWISCH